MVLGFLAAALRTSPGVGGHGVDERSEGDLKSCDVIDEQINPCG